MKKSFIYNCLTLLVAVMTTFSFTACGSDDDDTDYATLAAMQGALGGGGFTDSRAIDLGLSVKWANCNVGATQPWEYGGYYAWGETEEKRNYDWSTYKYCNGTDDSMTKYCTSSSYGTVDNKTTLEPADDVATVKCGGSWRMPTLDELKELINKCKCEWTTLNGVNGYRVTGLNGNSIFLPAAGYRRGSEVYLQGSHGGYWSSSLSSFYSDFADGLNFFFAGDNFIWDTIHDRYIGQSVRPVCK